MNNHEGRVDRPLRERLERLELDLARERKANAALRDVALALGTPLDLDNMLELVLAKAADLLEADRATLYLIDDATGELVSRHVTGGTVSTIRLSVGDGIAGSVVKSGKTIRVREAYKDKRFDRTWDLQTGYRTRAILAVPMKNHVGRTIGVLQVLNKRDGKEFSADDEGMLASLATQAAISIDNARLFLSVVQKNAQLRDAQQQLERKVAQLNLLFDLESAMARAGSEPELAEAVLRETVQAAQFSAGALLVSDPASELPILYWFRRGNEPLGSRPQSRPPADSLLARAMAGSPQLTPPAQDARPLAESSSLGFDVRSGVAVSLTSEEGAALGALGLYDPLDDRPLLDDDVELARLVAVNATTAVSLQRARDSRERTERLSTIGRLLSGVLHDLKTPMTVIAGYVQLLSMTEDPKLRANRLGLLARLHGAMNRVADLSRLAAG
ncbi:MAG TPA: GAF domain-containing protein [Polyangiaceae bacterium]|nr:GAF domain-containing protein [Polyangiaceae bacterium]